MHTRPLVVAAAIVLTLPLTAQCALQPVASGIGLQGLDGRVLAAHAWDPDGAGPAPEWLVVAGDFGVAGGILAEHIAAFDQATGQWHGLGTLPSIPAGFATLPNGTLLAYGWFLTSPTIAAVVMQWNGTAWSPYVTATSNAWASAMAVAPNGDLWIAMGSIHLFTGSTLQAIGTPSAFNPPEVRVLATAPNGDLVAGGLFDTMSGVAAKSLARWDGAQWSPYGAGIDGRVQSVAFAQNGDLIAGGFFPLAGGAPAANVARWNGGVWSPLGAGTGSIFPPAGVVRAVLCQANGDVIVGGEFDTAGGVPAARIARWDGANWWTLGTGIDPLPWLYEPFVSVLASIGADVFAAGNFRGAGGRDSTGLVRWDGAAWQPVRALGFGAGAVAVHVDQGGETFVGGFFREIDGQPRSGVAQRVGNSFQPLGIGLTPVAPSVPALATHFARDANGDLVVAGVFAAAGGVPAPAIARWNGATWQSLGTGLSSGLGVVQVSSMMRAANGDVLVAGLFDIAGGVPVESVARWDGTTWSALPPGLLNSPTSIAVLDAVAAMPNGDVFVAGTFDLGGWPFATQIAHWNGVTWQAVGLLDAGVYCLLPASNGELLVGGRFTSINGQPLAGIARFANGTWSGVGGATPLGSGPHVQRLALLPNGDVLAAGYLDGFTPPAGIARWDGAAWLALSGSMPGITDLAVDRSGRVYCAGATTGLAGALSPSFGSFATPCPASAIAGGAGCTGSGGANSLVAVTPPWIGAMFVAQASGMPANGLALAVYGLGTASIPLASLIPQGAPGCSLLVTPDLLSAYVITSNPLAVVLPLPQSPALVGAILYQQVVPLDIAPNGTIVALTSTNRLTLTLGRF